MVMREMVDVALAEFEPLVIEEAEEEGKQNIGGEVEGYFNGVEVVGDEQFVQDAAEAAKGEEKEIAEEQGDKVFAANGAVEVFLDKRKGKQNPQQPLGGVGFVGVHWFRFVGVHCFRLQRFF